MAYFSEGSFFQGALSIFTRLFITPAQDLYVYFKAFPTYFDFQYGETLLKPLKHLLNLKYFYVENEIYKFQFPYSEIKTGHANAAYLSNLYADYGMQRAKAERYYSVSPAEMKLNNEAEIKYDIQ